MRHVALRSFLLATFIMASTVNCAPPSSMLATGSALLESLGKTPTLTKIAGLLKTPGLGPLLDSVLGKKFTLLAPTNDALGALGEDVLGKLMDPSKVGDLANVLKGHIVPGKMDSADLLKGGLQTAGGKNLNLTGVKMGDIIEDKKFNIIPVDKILK